MKRERLRLDKKGTSMLFALLLFLTLVTLGVNLMNAVYANVSDTRKDLEKEQTLLYISSAFDIANKMIEDGEFYDKNKAESAKTAKAVLKTNDQDIAVEITMKESGSGLKALIGMRYNGNKYQVECYYKRQMTSEITYTLYRCNGLESET